jgi:hypothetical protein
VGESADLHSFRISRASGASGTLALLGALQRRPQPLVDQLAQSAARYSIESSTRRLFQNGATGSVYPVAAQGVAVEETSMLMSEFFAKLGTRSGARPRTMYRNVSGDALKRLASNCSMLVTYGRTGPK